MKRTRILVLILSLLLIIIGCTNDDTTSTTSLTTTKDTPTTTTVENNSSTTSSKEITTTKEDILTTTTTYNEPTTTQKPVTTTKENITTTQEPVIITTKEIVTTTQENITTTQEPFTTTQEEIITTTQEIITTTQENITTEHVHEYGEWHTIVSPTCTRIGLEERYCSCGGVDARNIEALGHNYSTEWTIDVEPTCTIEGSKSHHCLNCENKKDVTKIEALGHNYSDWIVVEPTETTNGYRYKKCRNCDVNYIDPDCTIDSLYHLMFELSEDESYYVVSGKTNYIYEEVVIPESYNNRPVREIKLSGFINNTQIKSIYIPPSISFIDKYAFLGCTSLKKVNISSLESWLNIDFGNQYSNPLYCAHNLYINDELVTRLTIPDGVTSIGRSTFSNCASLISITIPDSVTHIGYEAFENCSSLCEVHLSSIDTWYNITFDDGWSNPLYYAHNLYVGDDLFTELVIPNTITSVNEYIFTGCTSLTSITIPNTVTSIGRGAFSNCTSLISITIPASISSIGKNAFSNCSSITSIVIPNGITSIGEAVFASCSSLKSIIIPDSVTSIEEKAFYNCSSLESIIIPNTVTSVGKEAFSKCSSLKYVSIPKFTTLGSNCFYDCKFLKTAGPIGGGYDIEFGWEEELPAYAFANCKYLTSVALPNGIKKIGVACFYNSAISSITIPKSIDVIGESAFAECEKLYEIYNLSDVDIDSEMLRTGDTSKKQKDAVVIHSSLEEESIIKNLNGFLFYKYSDEYYLFDYIGINPNIVLPSFVEEETYLINKGAFMCNQLIETVVIPETIKTISDFSFDECFALKSVIIPEGIISIGRQAFSFCSSLTSLTIPNSVTSIDQSAFNRCYSLETIIIPNKISTICKYCFGYCSSLNTISLGKNIKKIESCAFVECLKLEKIIFDGTIEEWGQIIREEDVVTSPITNITTISDSFKECEVVCIDGTIVI